MSKAKALRQDHDQRLKTLLQMFFTEFLRLFFAAWDERLDAAKAKWLKEEVFLHPPRGRKRWFDLVAEIPLRRASRTPSGVGWFRSAKQPGR